MLASTIVLATLSAFGAAMPTSNNIARAGGPVAKPIPSSCTVTPLIPTNPTQGYLPAAEAYITLLYSAYYPSPSSNKTELAQECLEQCYGYGDSTECKTAYWAESVEVPSSYYNSPPGTYETACLFFKERLDDTDFTPDAEGHGTSPYAATITC
ncbi:hypothetical protein K491DRAFT_772936 [Lophiostoma macrostomum CBS 122681]|uniref:Apple domain-containing protein n=1 Tax=Lophiostoma macrostomum CBS 122681 TaxID=1314788 RepID=A0A6A6TRA6_9PLEO|nr:hypothetical protein K491DRAFT_772936 [Lophiostoma macrostomum CBS 122681]